MLLGVMSYFGGMGTFGQVLLGLPMVLDLLGRCHSSMMNRVPCFCSAEPTQARPHSSSCRYCSHCITSSTRLFDYCSKTPPSPHSSLFSPFSRQPSPHVSSSLHSTSTSIHLQLRHLPLLYRPLSTSWWKSYRSSTPAYSG